jgi:hypothetical protein
MLFKTYFSFRTEGRIEKRGQKMEVGRQKSGARRQKKGERKKKSVPQYLELEFITESLKPFGTNWF